MYSILNFYESSDEKYYFLLEVVNYFLYATLSFVPPLLSRTMASSVLNEAELLVGNVIAVDNASEIYDKREIIKLKVFLDISIIYQ